MSSANRPLLDSSNYTRGMLIDEEWMAGISRESDGYLAFIVNHSVGDIVARQVFPELDQALIALNRVPRAWKYEATSGCSGERCEEGKCKGEGCKIYSGPRT